MNNTIETNQSYQKFKEILTARHIISQWLRAGSVLLHQVISLSAVSSQPASHPMITILRNTYYIELHHGEGVFLLTNT